MTRKSHPTSYTMDARVDAVSIPNRPAFRVQEVCEIAGVPPFVLRGWEAEFPDLGVAKTAGGPRIYRRADVERVLRLKRLILVDGLTLAGARRKLAEEAELLEVGEAETAESAPPGAAVLAEDAKAHLQEVRRGLHWILDTLGGSPSSEFVLEPDTSAPRARRKAKKSSDGM